MKISEEKINKIKEIKKIKLFNLIKKIFKIQAKNDKIFLWKYLKRF